MASFNLNVLYAWNVGGRSPKRFPSNFVGVNQDIVVNASINFQPVISLSGSLHNRTGLTGIIRISDIVNKTQYSF